MSFDTFTAVCVSHELDAALSGSKIEKIYQPSRYTVVILCRRGGETRRLLLCATPGAARVGITETVRENPKTPPSFCQQLRRHISGATVAGIYTLGFERAVEIALDSHDELGFVCKRYLIIEIMGKYSNIIYAGDIDGKKKILGILRSGDITEGKRPLVSGAEYELPPSQGKAMPIEETYDGFVSRMRASGEKPCDEFILSAYAGFAPIAAREVAFRAGALGKLCCDVECEKLWTAFSAAIGAASGTSGSDGAVPTVVMRESGEPFDFSFTDIVQYGENAKKRCFSSFSSMLDFYFESKDTAAILRQKTHDIHTAVSGNRAKLAKKLNILKKELADCDEMDKYKRFGDLITASAYMLKQKAKYADVPDYYSCDGDKIETVRIPLDEKLTPAQNAARYYKKYTKLKTAKEILAEQIKIAETDLEYLASVEGAVALCESEADIDEIRRELLLGGYLHQSSEKGNQKPADKHVPKPARFITSGGRELICGRNNIQNDFVSMKLARKHDWWFHVKNSAGAHVIMLCEQGEEPDARDFTEAAELAAYYSSISDTQNAAVDYTLVKNLKKPSGAKPGKVVYYSNYTAYVTPKLSVKKL